MNTDYYCYQWAIIYAMYSPHVENHASRVLSYPVDDISANIISMPENTELNFTGLVFLLKVHNVAIFEEHNKNISVNILCLEGDDILGPIYYTKKEIRIHINLLMIQDDKDNRH